MEESRRKLKLLLKIGCGVFLLGILFYLVNWREAGILLLQAQPGPVCLAFMLFPLGFFLSTAKWKILLKAHQVELPFFQLYRYYHIGFFVSNFLPSNVGGDVARITFLSRQGKLAEVAASTVMERVTGFVILLFLTAAALWARPGYFDRFGILPILWVSVGCFLGVLFLAWAFGEHLSRWVDNVGSVSKNRLGWFFSRIGRLVGAILFFHDRRKVLIVSLILSALFYAVPILFQYLLFVALGFEIPLVEVVFIAPVVALVSFVPISFNALGVAEGAFVLFYSQLGVLPEQALAAAFLRRIIQLLVSLIGGGFLLNQSVKPLKGK